MFCIFERMSGVMHHKHPNLTNFCQFMVKIDVSEETGSLIPRTPIISIILLTI